MTQNLGTHPVQLHVPVPPARAAVHQRWPVAAVQALLDRPLLDLVFEAQSVHRQHWPEGDIELATLLSVKTGGCPENCGYCPQSAEFDTGVKAQKMLEVDEVLQAAQAAKQAGATRFCMGAAWRAPKDRDIEKMGERIAAVKALGLQTCATLGMLEEHQALALKDAGLDYYNHNLDTAPDYYDSIIHTRQYQDRLDTLEHVRDAGLKTCCGGIVGMGETRRDRASLLHALATLPEHPDSLPVNALVPVAGTPLGDRISREGEIDAIEFVRTVAVARLVCPASVVRLSAGREGMTPELQALCFLAGANSIFYGDKLLTTGNPDTEADLDLLRRLGLKQGQPVPLQSQDLA